jgi:hypothetical protein
VAPSFQFEKASSWIEVGLEGDALTLSLTDHARHKKPRPHGTGVFVGSNEALL